MKVLLMVEREGRVVCAARWRNTDVGRATMNIAWARSVGLRVEGVSKPLREVAAADRWWLVEAESAEAARQIIAAKKSWRGDVLDKSERTLYASPDGTLFEGRILASGGKS